MAASAVVPFARTMHRMAGQRARGRRAEVKMTFSKQAAVLKAFKSWPQTLLGPAGGRFRVLVAGVLKVLVHLWGEKGDVSSAPSVACGVIRAIARRLVATGRLRVGFRSLWISADK